MEIFIAILLFMLGLKILFVVILFTLAPFAFIFTVLFSIFALVYGILGTVFLIILKVLMLPFIVLLFLFSPFC